VRSTYEIGLVLSKDDDHEEELVDLDALDDEIVDMHTHLINENTKMVQRSRRQADKMHSIANKLESMADNAREIASLHVLGARQCAEILADLIDGEFDISILTMGDDEPDGLQDD
jgi:hypothetical protein